MKLFTTSIEKRLIKNFDINNGREHPVDHKVVVKLLILEVLALGILQNMIKIMI